MVSFYVIYVILLNILSTSNIAPYLTIFIIIFIISFLYLSGLSHLNPPTGNFLRIAQPYKLFASKYIK